MIKKGDGLKLKKLREGSRFIQIKVNYDYWKRVKAAAALEDKTLEEMLDDIIRFYIDYKYSRLKSM
ncbi:MAG: hypothetical protein GTN76_13050 [Candidatus Aenigmarchaeota archaeon]|nr:hypothetical protein [Candidatus Aenigmarchaeota archaeon]